MKRYTLIAIALTCCITPLLMGCSHEHAWVAATCTEPKTCEECGETEGDPLGHSWEEATCKTPKTCSVCGATEGKALGHDWIEATHEKPKTCARCGKTRGDVLLYDVPSGFTDGYQFGEFDTYNSYAGENGLGDTLVWINGAYDDVSTLDLPEVKQGFQIYLAYVKDENDNVWLLELDWNENIPIEKFQELEKHQLCILGQYQGYSDVYEMPAILMERAFDRTTGNIIASAWYADSY